MNTFSLMLRADRHQFRKLIRVWWMLLPLPAILLLPMRTPLADSPRYWTFLQWPLALVVLFRYLLLLLFSLKILDKETPADPKAWWRARPFSPRELLLEKIRFLFVRLLLPLSAVNLLEVLLLAGWTWSPMRFWNLFMLPYLLVGTVFLGVVGGRNDREAIAWILGLPFILSLMLSPPLLGLFERLEWGAYQILPPGLPLRPVLIVLWIFLFGYWIWQRYRMPRPALYGWIRLILLVMLLRPVFMLKAPPRLPPAEERSDLLASDAQINRSWPAKRVSYHFQVELNPGLFTPKSIEPTALRLLTLHSISPDGQRLPPPEEDTLLLNPLLLRKFDSLSLRVARNLTAAVGSKQTGFVKSWIEITPIHLEKSPEVPLRPGTLFTDRGMRYRIQEVIRTDTDTLRIKIHYFGVPDQRSEEKLPKVVLKNLQTGRRHAGDLRQESSTTISGWFHNGTRTSQFRTVDAETEDLVLEILRFRPGSPTVSYVEIPLR